MWPYSGGAQLVLAKIVDWACTYPQNPHSAGAWLPNYRHTLHMPRPEVSDSEGVTGNHAIWGGRDRRTKKPYYSYIPWPSTFPGTQFSIALPAWTFCQCSWLALLNKIASACYFLSARSSPSVRPPRKSFVGEAMIEPRTHITLTSKCR